MWVLSEVSDHIQYCNNNGWLPVYGHSHGCIFKPWLTQRFSMSVGAIPQFKTYRNKRLGDISSVDVVRMVLEFSVYQQAELIAIGMLF